MENDFYKKYGRTDGGHKSGAKIGDTVEASTYGTFSVRDRFGNTDVLDNLEEIKKEEKEDFKIGDVVHLKSSPSATRTVIGLHRGNLWLEIDNSHYTTGRKEYYVKAPSKIYTIGEGMVGFSSYQEAKDTSEVSGRPSETIKTWVLEEPEEP